MLMINESSLSTVEIGLDSDFKAFYIREEKRREKKEGEKQERERERELKWEKWTLSTLRQKRERENDSFYFFRFV
jgi:hypothetical protein